VTYVHHTASLIEVILLSGAPNSTIYSAKAPKRIELKASMNMYTNLFPSKIDNALKRRWNIRNSLKSLKLRRAEAKKYSCSKVANKIKDIIDGISYQCLVTNFEKGISDFLYL
jgi:hypothetical protein